MKKTILGHSHTPAIAKGTYAVGTATSLDLHYNTAAAMMWRIGKVKKEDLAAAYRELYGGVDPYSKFAQDFPPPRRREAIEHTRRKLGL